VNVRQDVRANVTINADPKDVPAIEDGTREGLGRATRDMVDALHEEID
jgi:hypothetical protein